MKVTKYENKALILGQVWVELKDDENWKEFIHYNDVGLPLAFALSEEIISNSPELENYINETWRLLLEGMEIEDLGYEELDELINEQNS